MTTQFRSVRPDDYPTLAAVANAAFPGVQHTAEELRDDDAPPPPPLKFHRWVAERNGEVIGSTSYFQSQSRYDPRRFWMDGFVQPDHQRTGIGSELLSRLMAAIAPYDPIQLRCATREDLHHSIAFLERRGFVEGKRTWVSHLDLERFDPTRFTAAPAEIHPLTALMDQPGWEQRLLDLYNEIQLDIPDIDPAATVTMEQFRASQLIPSRLQPHCRFIAVDGDRWIGVTGMNVSEEDPTKAMTGITGVVRSYRGRGVAMALKLHSLAWARAAGVKQIKTMNASNNRPMLAINEKLGFVKDPAWIHMVYAYGKNE